MRDWSHHHSTNTLDDPVFRAAMRGCDSVSFTFALEVTWSKIQQRQQEEEDRKALEELNALREMQEENEDDDEEIKNQKSDSEENEITDDQNNDAGDDSANNVEERIKSKIEIDAEKMDDDTDVKKAAKVNKDAIVKELNDQDVASETEMDDFIVKDSENEKSEDEDVVEAEEVNDMLIDSDDDSDSNEVAVAETVASSDDSSGESSPEKSPSDSSSGSVSAIEALSPSPSHVGGTQEAEIVDSPGEESTSAPESSSEWSCPFCTMKNAVSRKSCSVCKKRRTSSAKKEKRSNASSQKRGTKRRAPSLSA
jgi:hypothetical protein